MSSSDRRILLSTERNRRRGMVYYLNQGEPLIKVEPKHTQGTTVNFYWIYYVVFPLSAEFVKQRP